MVSCCYQSTCSRFRRQLRHDFVRGVHCGSCLRVRMFLLCQTICKCGKATRLMGMWRLKLYLYTAAKFGIFTQIRRRIYSDSIVSIVYSIVEFEAKT